MTVAIAANDSRKFAELLLEFEEIDGWNHPYADVFLSLLREVIESPEPRESCMVSLYQHDPDRFTQEIWFRVAGTAPLGCMAAIFAIDYNYSDDKLLLF